jgi:peptide/nickel transport system substrate-binding protein
MINHLLSGRQLRGPVRAGVRLVAVAVAVVLAVAGCTSGGEGPAGKPILRIGLGSTQVSLDPAKDHGGPHQVMMALTNEPIIHSNPDGSLGPGLATSWRYVGSGNTTFEFTLRHDARFSDGTPVNAGAVKTWLDYFVKAKGPFATVMNLKSVQAIGEWTVRLHLASPDPLVPMNLTQGQYWGSVSSPKAVADPSALGTRTFGAGPYTIDPSQTVSGSQYTLVPNGFYYDPAKIRFSKVVVKIIESPSSMLAAIKTGQLEVAYGDRTTVSRAESAGVSVVAVPAGEFGMLLLDSSGVMVEALSDKRVRQALNYALDRDTIVEGLYGEAGTPTSEYLTFDGFDPSYKDYYPYDPAKARSLLAAAGYPNGFTLKVLAQGQAIAGLGGTPLAQAMGKYLAAVGVNLEITSAATEGEFGQKLAKFPVLAGNLPPLYMVQLYTTFFAQGGLANPFSQVFPTLDALYQKSLTAAPDEAPTYWREMSQEITEQGYFVPVVETDSYWFATKNVHGLAASIESPIPLATDWRLE